MITLSILFNALSLILLIRIAQINPLSLCIPFVALHLIFYMPSFYIFLAGSDSTYSIFYQYSIMPFKSDVIFWLFFISVNLAWMTMIFYLTIKEHTPRSLPKLDIPFYKIKFLILLLITGFIIADSISRYSGSSLIYLFSPSRKELGFSGFDRALISLVPIVFAIMIFNTKQSIYRFIFLTSCLLLIIFILGQRRQIIMLLLFCIAFNWRRELFQMSRLSIIWFLGSLALFAALIIPASWYLRTFSTRQSRGEVITQNLLEIRSPIELLFGSSTKGFESLFLQLHYLEIGVLKEFHSLKFAVMSIIPRSILEDKPSSIVAEIAHDAGTSGSTSAFFMSETITTFGIFTPFFLTIFAFLYAFLDKLQFYSRAGLVVFICFWANSIHLFKNGWSSVISFYFLLFILIFILLSSLRRLRI